MPFTISNALPKAKVKALLWYVCSKVPLALSGVIKINKIMWFSETETIYRTGSMLSGHTYIRQKFGPVALNAHILREELIAENKLKEIIYESSASLITRAYQAMGEINIYEYFTEKQIEIIDEIIERHQGDNAKDISDMSHDSIWASLEDADVMPLELYMIKPFYTSEQEASVRAYATERWEREYGAV